MQTGIAEFVKWIALPFGLAILAMLAVAIYSGAHAQGPYIYPTKGQSQDQQNRDRYECHDWAVSQTGFDPTQAQGPGYVPPPQQGQVARGAVGGAAIGAVGGAIGGDAGKGAAIGAGAGALIGGVRRRQQQQQYQDQVSQQQNAYAAQQNAYNRALAACLQGRGYTVN